ncbi:MULTISPECIES: calcineurin-like phosphoesterase family protein [Micrococcaceae]|uniref:calcineurin-like phosphoesterase C-terminal domain-containing protein n=1 Tax=Micrococcaceae TaxID=1268 RepID=UPI0010369FD4|nr:MULTISPECIES: calcineurin-like phosphoesterase family protein [Micrococcaceae]TAP25066.1 phosphoesterase [Arthrobacter sp. S41]UXN32048.1 calcineurin-like phosphoesterase family protein [Glutamicibacter sp. M10]
MKFFARPGKTNQITPLRATAGALVVLAASAGLTAANSAPDPEPAAKATADWKSSAYRGSVQVVRAEDEKSAAKDKSLEGVVFEDSNKNSKQDANEPGLPKVTVSNGRDVVTTDGQGRYELPAFENMTAFVTQPRGFQVPVDENNVAQFSYIHLPEGSPKLKYGGIAPTGGLPEAVNFPLTRSTATQSPEQSCAIGADVQTYNQKEVEYARKGAFADLAARTDYTGCGVLFIGDLVGNDLSLFAQTRELTSMLNGPARFLPGNHDIDFDSVDGVHEFDTYRAQFGPEYYSYDTGKTHVVALNTIEYPTKLPAKRSDYTYQLGEQQLEWLRADIAKVPKNKAIVLAGHSPLLEFFFNDEHTTKEVKEIYKILKGREVVSLGGHTHMSENLREGDLMKGWIDEVGQDGLPFTHLTVPAVAGQWYGGRVTETGYPTSLQQDGTPPGVLTLDIKNTKITERFTPTGGDDSNQMAVGLNTPAYRDWYEENVDKKYGTIPALKNPLTVSRAGLANDTWLTTNVWMGSTGSTVKVSIDGEDPVKSTRTQSLTGETALTGAKYSDPVAIAEQFVHGGGLPEKTSHLWRLELPDDLKTGSHTAQVTATDVHGRSFTDKLEFEVTD